MGQDSFKKIFLKIFAITAFLVFIYTISLWAYWGVSLGLFIITIALFPLGFGKILKISFFKEKKSVLSSLSICLIGSLLLLSILYFLFNGYFTYLHTDEFVGYILFTFLIQIFGINLEIYKNNKFWKNLILISIFSGILFLIFAFFMSN